MYPVGNGPGFDWEEFMRQQQRAGLAAGGVPPAAPPADPPIAEPPPIEIEDAAPSQAQRTAKEVFGIGSTGPLADRATQGVDDYAAKRAASFNALGQHEPQQFGSIENTFLAEGPLKPKDAVEAFMAKKTPDEIARYSKMKPKVVSPQEQLAKNEAYDAKVQQDRMKREQERDRLREQGYRNRDATRDKTAAAWEQTLGLNALQGAGPLARGGGGGAGPMSRRVDGAILLGPGMGEPQYGYGGRSGGFRGRSPEELDLERQELARRKAKDENDALLGGRRVKVAEGGLETRRDAMKFSQDAQMWARKFRETGLEEDRREAVTQGANALTALASDIQRRQAYAKQNVGTFFGPGETDLRDVAFDDKGKPGKPSKGEYRKRVDVLRNQLKELNQIDPSRSWAAGLSEETVDFIKAALDEMPAASPASVP